MAEDEPVTVLGLGAMGSALGGAFLAAGVAEGHGHEDNVGLIELLFTRRSTS